MLLVLMIGGASLRALDPDGFDGVSEHEGCRGLHSTYVVNGKPRTDHALACPRPDGTWRIVQ